MMSFALCRPLLTDICPLLVMSKVMDGVWKTAVLSGGPKNNPRLRSRFPKGAGLGCLYISFIAIPTAFTSQPVLNEAVLHCIIFFLQLLLSFHSYPMFRLANRDDWRKKISNLAIRNFFFFFFDREGGKAKKIVEMETPANHFFQK